MDAFDPRSDLRLRSPALSDLNERQLAALVQGFRRSESIRWDRGERLLNEDEIADHWHQFCKRVLGLLVWVHAGGRASVEPQPPAGYYVNIYYTYDRKAKAYELDSFQVIPKADGSLRGVTGLNLNDYVTAWAVWMPERKSPRATPRKRPAPGEPPDLDFYRRLIASRDALLAEGNRAPAKELARRYKTNYSTVKSWLKRGRKYLDEETN
jgi:hypothetical protein